MNIPLAYPIPLPRAPLQGVATADRPLCALVAAYSQFLKGSPMMGAWRYLEKGTQDAQFAKHFTEFDVPPDRAHAWALAINGAKSRRFDRGDFCVGDFALDPYQMQAIEAMTAEGGVLAMGCGLGKTASAVKAAILRGGTRCWILCPLNAVGAWRRWVPTLKAHFTEVEVLSMDSAHKFVGAANTGGVIIFDEVHLLGDASARRTSSCHKIRPLFDYGLCLTGTLLHGGVEKTMSMLDLAVPGAALFANRWKAGEYFNCLVKKHIGTRNVTALEKPVGPNKVAFMEYLSRMCVSLNKHSDVVRQSLQLPEQTIHTIDIGKPWGTIEDAVADYVRKVIDAGGELPHAQEVAHALCRDGLDAKVEWILDAVDSPDISVVVFAAYRGSLDRIEAGAKGAGLSYVRVDGGVTGADRVECQRKFQAGEAQLFIGQMDAACTSMDLFRAQVSIAVDHTWKAANYNQALARTCRRGQTQETHHFDLVYNPLQSRVVKRLAASEDFDASLSEWQELKSAIQTTNQGETHA